MNRDVAPEPWSSRRHKSCRLLLVGLLSSLMLFALALSITLAASVPAQASAASNAASWALPAAYLAPPLAPALQANTSLSVDIVSSPWAPLDHNNPSGVGEEVPNVLIVEAAVTNTGAEIASDVNVLLDYNEDPGVGWVLLTGENPRRTIRELAPGETYHAYWFAGYSTNIGATHRYTVTAFADNADSVSTWNNYFGDPAQGATVQTQAYQSTGSSGARQYTMDTIVGVVFTITVNYDLGNNPNSVMFGAVGNEDFDPGSFRLLETSVRIYDETETQESIVQDQLYFPTLPDYAEYADVTYILIPLAEQTVRLCSYAGVSASRNVYDQFYCDAEQGSVVPLTSTLSLSLAKEASSSLIQQNQLLTYTLHYTNNSDQALSYVWIWDDIDPNIGSTVPSSITPPSDPNETTDSRVAWYLNDVPGNATGTLSFAVLVDGAGADLSDGTVALNEAFFGVNQDSLASDFAVSSSASTTVQAPTMAVSKTDGRTTAEQGDSLTHNLRITNTGSVAATQLTVTDVLPADVVYADGSASPPETLRLGQTLVWEIPGSIEAGGGTYAIDVPVTVAPKVSNGAELSNTMTVQYANTAGHVFGPTEATDGTIVQAPDLSVSKSGSPEPVLTGNLLNYALNYANNGPVAATNAVITDVVPTNTTYEGCSGGDACALLAGDVVSWTVGTFAPGAGGSVGFSVRVDVGLAEGDSITNSDYAILADQTNLVLGSPITTTASKNAGFIDGFAYIDTNGDGEKDDTEAGIPDVDVQVAGVTVSESATTDGDGYYRVRIESQEPVSATADAVPSLFRTTAGTVFLDTLLGVTQTVDFGYAPDASGMGAIYGTVFEDLNHNQIRDLGENGISGVIITSSEAMTPSVVTNASGQYTLRFNSSGAVTVTESNPSSHVSTTPDVVATNATIGSSGPSPVDFGDFAGVKITGQVFDDQNVDGSNDDAVFVAGAVVAADSDRFTTTLAAHGVYTLYASVAGSPVTIVETDPSGYASTNAVPGSGMSRVDANTLEIPSPVAGTVYTGGDFGDVMVSDVITISGQVWDDNGAGGGGAANGVRDGEEPSLAGAIISLSSGMTQTTGADGLFLLYAPPGQAVTVTETNPSGYVSTNAIAGNDASKRDNDTLLVGPLADGATSAGNLFGDAAATAAALVTGTVFDDANENGVFDLGELGLSGVTVTLEFSDGGTIVVTTDAAGQYGFSVAPGTSVRITSAGPGASFYPTTPESVIVQPPTSGTFPNNDFGYSDNASVAVIFGTVFDDANGNGLQDIAELGLAGARITLDGTETLTTTGNGLITGTFSFVVTEAGIHSVQEVNSSGYRSTTPDAVNVPVTLGSNYLVQFGDTQSATTATIYGTVFDDLNGDGIQDSTEPLLSGVVVSVTVSGGVITDTTRDYGQFGFGFQFAEAGLHKVSEQNPARPDYRSTTPDDVNLNVVPGNSYVVNFGDTLDDTFSSIMGTVFDDENGDGQQNPSELGIGDVLLSLSNGVTTTTEPDGRYTLAVTETGAFLVSETDLLDYHSTTPNEVVVDVAALDAVYTVNFGDTANTLVASIFGTVFDDLNANATRESTEPGMESVTVEFSGSSSPYVTNEWGQFTFLVDSAGTYTVTETDPPGYISTAAVPGSPAVSALNRNTFRAEAELGVDLGDNLFGDTERLLGISKVAEDLNGEPLYVGDLIRYTVNVTNLSSSVMTGVVLTDTLPEGVTFVAATPAGFSGPNPLAWGGEILPGATWTVVVTVEVDGTANPIGGNVAAVRSDQQPEQETEPVYPPGGGSVELGLAIAKTAEDLNGEPLYPGDEIAYSIIVTNTNTSYSQANVTISDTIPTSTTLVPDSITCSPGATCGASGDVVSATVAMLDAGDLLTLTFSVSVDAGVTAIGGNVAAVASDDQKELRTDPVYPPGGGSVEPGLAIAKTAEDLNGEPLYPGDEIAYSIIVTNTNTSYGQANVTISDTVPTSTTLVPDSITCSPGATCGASGDVVSATVAMLDAGDLLTLTFNVSVDAGVTAIGGNVAAVRSDDQNQIATDPVYPPGGGSVEPGLAIAKTAEDLNGAPLFPGDEVLYTVTVTNTNTSYSQANVTISDTVPSGTTLVPGSITCSPGATCGASGDVVSANVGTLGPGAVLELSFRATVAEDAPALGGNVAAVESDDQNELRTDPVYPPGFGTYAIIYGMVFEDTNGDGIRDPGEPSLSDVEITFDGSETANTGADGTYAFSTTVAGTHTVVETDPPGYTSTTPNTVDVEAALGEQYRVDFGDRPEGPCTCPGDAYEEDDTPDDAKTLELGRANSQDHDFCDDAVDWLKFTAQTGRVYTVTTSSWGHNADTELAIYDQEGIAELVSSDDYSEVAAPSSQIEWEAPADGTYYILLTNAEAVTGCETNYEIWLERTQAPDKGDIYLPLVVLKFTPPTMKRGMR
jgi:uncharacterized repeat protein (TIGR01451 family)